MLREKRSEQSDTIYKCCPHSFICHSKLQFKVSVCMVVCHIQFVDS